MDVMNINQGLELDPIPPDQLVHLEEGVENNVYEVADFVREV